jgi:hypothetical protein
MMAFDPGFRTPSMLIGWVNDLVPFRCGKAAFPPAQQHIPSDTAAPIHNCRNRPDPKHHLQANHKTRNVNPKALTPLVTISNTALLSKLGSPSKITIIADGYKAAKDKGIKYVIALSEPINIGIPNMTNSLDNLKAALVAKGLDESQFDGLFEIIPIE